MNRKVYLTKEELYDLYVSQCLSTVEIAKMLGCTAKTISNNLVSLNIPRRSFSEATKLQAQKKTPEMWHQRAVSVHKTWSKKSEEEKREIFANRHVDAEVIADAVAKAKITKMNNGTCKKSKAEDRFYQKLLLDFDASDIIRQYVDDRYPYNCDFYIPSKDLFIEYQGHYTHGNEPFDECNTEHQMYLQSHQDIDLTTWVKRDVEKLKVAKNSGIKLLLVYPRHNNYLVYNNQIVTVQLNELCKM